MALLSACALPDAPVAPQPQTAAPAPPVATVPPSAPSEPPVDRSALLLEEAKALLAQAETDIQRARARRALWQSAWEDLLASRQAFSARDHAAAIRHARRASDLARLGLEQLAYPAVK